MTSFSGQTNADLLRLEHADSQQLDETLKSLLERGEALDTVAEIIERKIDNGVYVLREPLAVLISRTKSKSLYAKTQQQLFEGYGELLILYKSGYPDPDIEKTLSTRLYKIASNDAEPWREMIVDAMHEVGTEALLPTLDAILFDLTSNLQVKEMIVQAIESANVESYEALLTKLETGSRKSFVTAVANAITAIKARGDALKESRLNEEVSQSILEELNAQKSRQAQATIATRPLADQLKNIELQLHSHIKRRLQERYGADNDGWWFEGIPETIRLECAQRREKDRGRQEPFNYTYLIDLKTVLDKNWSLFEPDFSKIRNVVSSKKTSWTRSLG